MQLRAILFVMKVNVACRAPFPNTLKTFLYVGASSDSGWVLQSDRPSHGDAHPLFSVHPSISPPSVAFLTDALSIAVHPRCLNRAVLAVEVLHGKSSACSRALVKPQDKGAFLQALGVDQWVSLRVLNEGIEGLGSSVAKDADQATRRRSNNVTLGSQAPFHGVPPSS